MGIALVGTPTSASPAVGGSATKNITIPSTTAGNTLTLCSRSKVGATNAITGITINGVAWTVEEAIQDANAGNVEIWAIANIPGSQTTVAVTFGSGYAGSHLVIAEWSGMPATLTKDGGSTNSGHSGTSSGSVTPANGPCLIIFSSGSNETAYPTGGPSGGFSQLGTTGGVTGSGAFAYLIQTSPAAASTGFTLLHSYDYWATAIVGLDGSSGGGSSVVSRRTNSDNARTGSRQPN